MNLIHPSHSSSSYCNLSLQKSLPWGFWGFHSFTLLLAQLSQLMYITSKMKLSSLRLFTSKVGLATGCLSSRRTNFRSFKHTIFKKSVLRKSRTSVYRPRVNPVLHSSHIWSLEYITYSRAFTLIGEGFRSLLKPRARTISSDYPKPFMRPRRGRNLKERFRALLRQTNHLTILSKEKLLSHKVVGSSAEITLRIKPRLPWYRRRQPHYLRHPFMFLGLRNVPKRFFSPHALKFTKGFVRWLASRRSSTSHLCPFQVLAHPRTRQLRKFIRRFRRRLKLGRVALLRSNALPPRETLRSTAQKFKRLRTHFVPSKPRRKRRISSPRPKVLNIRHFGRRHKVFLPLANKFNALPYSRWTSKPTRYSGHRLTQLKLRYGPFRQKTSAWEPVKSRAVRRRHLAKVTAFLLRRPRRRKKRRARHLTATSFAKTFLLNMFPRLPKVTSIKYRDTKILNLAKTISCYFTLPIILKKSHNIRTRFNNYDPSFTPTSALTFQRSPFFFLNFYSLIRDPFMDVFSASRDLKPRTGYVVFPDANSIKVTVFRRLNRQKFLAQSRSQTTLSVVRKISNDTKIRTKQVPLPSGELVTKTDGPNMQFAKSWSSYRLFQDIYSGIYKEPRIRRIRFKPGYGRIWRTARVSAREILGLTSRYQYRLTPKLQRRYLQLRKIRSPSYTLTLGFALMLSRLSTDEHTLHNLLSSHNVFLNGTSVSSPHIRLFVGDFIQLIVNIKFYIALRWIKNGFISRRGRVNKIFYRKFRPAPFNKNIRVVRKLPTWFFDLEYAYGSLPGFFELDYFTLSIFMIHDRFLNAKWTPMRAYMFDSKIINMYNWKYIT